MVSIACAAGCQATPYRSALLLATVGVRHGQARRELTPGHAAFSQFGLIRWQTIDMPQTYWLDLFTVETWQEFLDHGGDITGFSAGRVTDSRRGGGLECPGQERQLGGHVPGPLRGLCRGHHDQGPCLECVRTGAAVVSADLGADRPRWLLFASSALAGSSSNRRKAVSRNGTDRPWRQRSTHCGSTPATRTSSSPTSPSPWSTVNATPGFPRRLHSSDRQNVVYAAAGSVSMPTCRNRVCMPMRRVS